MNKIMQTLLIWDEAIKTAEKIYEKINKGAHPPIKTMVQGKNYYNKSAEALEYLKAFKELSKEILIGILKGLTTIGTEYASHDDEAIHIEKTIKERGLVPFLKIATETGHTYEAYSPDGGTIWIRHANENNFTLWWYEVIQ